MLPQYWSGSRVDVLTRFLLFPFLLRGPCATMMSLKGWKRITGDPSTCPIPFLRLPLTPEKVKVVVKKRCLHRCVMRLFNTKIAMKPSLFARVSQKMPMLLCGVTPGLALCSQGAPSPSSLPTSPTGPAQYSGERCPRDNLGISTGPAPQGTHLTPFYYSLFAGPLANAHTAHLFSSSGMAWWDLGLWLWGEAVIFLKVFMLKFFGNKDTFPEVIQSPSEGNPCASRAELPHAHPSWPSSDSGLEELLKRRNKASAPCLTEAPARGPWSGLPAPVLHPPSWSSLLSAMGQSYTWARKPKEPVPQLQWPAPCSYSSDLVSSFW